MVQLHYPPANPHINRSSRIFLAGTIDMGNSRDWQKEIVDLLGTKWRNYAVFNPRRPDWNNSWTSNSPEFIEQVNWEIDYLQLADHIIMCFMPDSMSPISLFELGLFITSPNIHIYCPDEFYRSGNVDVYCRRWNHRVHKDWDKFKEYLSIIL